MRERFAESNVLLLPILQIWVLKIFLYAGVCKWDSLQITTLIYGQLKEGITEGCNNISSATFNGVRNEVLQKLSYCSEVEDSEFQHFLG